MLRATTTKTGTLKGLVDAVKLLVGEANLYCAPAGLVMQGMDTSNVSMVAFKLPSTWFSEYVCPQNVVLGLNFLTLEKLFKCAEKTDQTVLMSRKPFEKLLLFFEARDRITDFDVSVLDLDAEVFEIPETEYACSVSMPAQNFKDLVANLNVAGEQCSVCVTRTEVRFTATGTLGSLSLALKDNSSKPDVDNAKRVCITMGKEFDGHEDAKLEQSFLSSKLLAFSKAAISSRVTLHMSCDTPLLVEYPLGEDPNGYLRFYLAPNIVP